LSEPICKVCGFPLSEHSLDLYWGAAHATVRGADGRILHRCSQAAGDYNYTLGQLQELTTMVRSLRIRAGRLRNQGTAYDPADMVEWSDKLARDIERLRRGIDDYFAWTQEKNK
jgi:hypothetical protein